MGKLKEIRGYGDCDRVKLGLSGISCFFCDCTFSGFIKINRDKREILGSKVNDLCLQQINDLKFDYFLYVWLCYGG